MNAERTNNKFLNKMGNTCAHGAVEIAHNNNYYFNNFLLEHAQFIVPQIYIHISVKQWLCTIIMCVFMYYMVPSIAGRASII